MPKDKGFVFIIHLYSHWHTNGSPNPGQKTRPNVNWEKKKPCHRVDFEVRADHRVEIKEDKYLDFAKELRKLWNVMVPVIPIAVGALRTVPKGLERGLEELEIRGRIETIQTTTLLRLARILGRVQETWGDFPSFRLQWTTAYKHWCEKLARSEEIIVLENETSKILWDFEIQTNQQIPARRPDLLIINKKKENLPNCGLCFPDWP